MERYRELYARSAYLGRDYKDVLAARVRKISDRYGLVYGMVDYKPEVWIEEQGAIFE